MPKHVVSDDMGYIILQGGYDAEDRRLLNKYVRPGDYIVDCGGGCGLTAMAAYRLVQPSDKVLMIKPDPRVHALARQHFELNGASAIESRAAAAVADPGLNEVTFYRSKNFWGSTLLGDDDGRRVPFRVPGVYLPDIVDRTFSGRRILFCDVEGYESNLLADSELLKLFEIVMVELHFARSTSDARSPFVNMFEALFAQGFAIIDVDQTVFVFAKRNLP